MRPVAAGAAPVLPPSAPSELMAPMTWCVQPGAAGVPLVRCSGTALLVLAAGLAGAWCVGMAQDLLNGGRSAWVLLWGAPLAWWWFHQLRTVWRQWHAVPPHLALVWTGPVQSDPPSGGWRLEGDPGAPATVDCVVDGHLVMLCRIRVAAVSRGAAARDAASHPVNYWCWIDMRRCPDAHRFRTLMGLARRLTTAEEGEADGKPRSMASWGIQSHRSGVALQESPRSFLPTQPMRFDDVVVSDRRQERV